MPLTGDRRRMHPRSPLALVLTARQAPALRLAGALTLALTCLLGSALPGASQEGELAQTPPPASQPARERFFGAVQAISNPTRAVEAGVQWERLIFPWYLIQPNGPNDWQKGYYTDEEIDREIARGIEVVGIALYTPPWAVSDRGLNVPANQELAFDDPRNHWGQFMFKLAERYRGKINTWVVANEPDMDDYSIRYNWGGTPEDLYQHVKVASLAVKKANPQARIALPGMTYWWDKEYGRPQYLERFLQAAQRDPSGAANGYHFDIVTVHQYGNPLNVYAVSRLYQRMLEGYGMRKAIWVGESNVIPAEVSEGQPVRGPWHADMDQQASFMIQAYALGRAAGVERMSVYKMVDEAPEGGLNDLYGLVRNDGSIRPAFTAYQTAVRYLSNPTSVSYVVGSSDEPLSAEQESTLLRTGMVHSQFIWPAAVNRVILERGAERVTVIWNAAPQPATARWPAESSSANVVDKFGRSTGELIARDGFFTLALGPSLNNTDPRDRSLYLIGGDPRIVVERVTPLPTSVDAPIQVVWPHPGATPATQANVSAVLLQPNTLRAVPCRWNPTVRLMAATEGGAPRAVATGVRRLETQAGLTYPVWDFNGVDVNPGTAGRRVEFWVDVDGVRVNAPRWAYGADLPQPETWQQRPTTSCE